MIRSLSLHSPTTTELIKEATKQVESLPKERRRDFLKKGIAISVGTAIAMSARETLRADEFKPDPKNLPPRVSPLGVRVGGGM